MKFDNYTFESRRDQKIPTIWFIANSGGILGLCMGFSMVTVRKIIMIRNISPIHFPHFSCLKFFTSFFLALQRNWSKEQEKWNHHSKGRKASSHDLIIYVLKDVVFIRCKRIIYDRSPMIQLVQSRQWMNDLYMKLYTSETLYQ